MWGGGNATREHLKDYALVDLHSQVPQGCPGAVPPVRAALEQLAARGEEKEGGGGA